MGIRNSELKLASGEAFCSVYDAAFIAQALGNIARARGMTQLARDTGLAREGLYKALSADGNPSFATILKVTKALGLKLRGEVAHA